MCSSDLSKRRILKSIDAEKLLRDFARWNALQVLHLWPEAPEIVVRFLKTGDEPIRAAARAAAWDAARAAAWDAARAAAWAAARDAAGAAARDAARDAFIAKSRNKFASMVKKALSQIP